MSTPCHFRRCVPRLAPGSSRNRRGSEDRRAGRRPSTAPLSIIQHHLLVAQWAEAKPAHQHVLKLPFGTSEGPPRSLFKAEALNSLVTTSLAANIMDIRPEPHGALVMGYKSAA